MVLAYIISDDDYRLVNEAYSRERDKASIKKWRKHHTIDDMFREDVEWIKRLERARICESYKEIRCFATNSNVLSEDLRDVLDSTSGVLFPVTCFELLYQHHDADEGQIYMLSAFKFLLKAIEVIKIETFVNDQDASWIAEDESHGAKSCRDLRKIMWDYLKTVEYFELPKVVNLWIFEVFCMDKDCLISCFLPVTHLKTTLDACYHQRVDFFGIFKEEKYFEKSMIVTNFLLTEIMTYDTGKMLTSLLLMGARNVYNKEDYSALRKYLAESFLTAPLTRRKLVELPGCRYDYSNVISPRIATMDQRWCNFFPQLHEICESLRRDHMPRDLRRQSLNTDLNDDDGMQVDDSIDSNEEGRGPQESIISNDLIQIKFRCYQVLRLYLAKPEIRALVLRTIWNTITDSFLTLEDFELIRGGVSDSVMREWFNWYESVVTWGKIESKEPRCLQHLTRCAIRRIMGENFSLPEGIDQLPLPKRLKTYVAAINQPRRLRHLTRCFIRNIVAENASLPKGIDQLPISKELQVYLATDRDPFGMYF